MTSINEATIAKKITHVFLIGAALLLICYGFLFKNAVLLTENKTGMHRLFIIAPHYLSQYEHGTTDIIKIDPLLTSYGHFQQLPTKIKQVITPEWVGVDSLHFEEDDSEFAIVAQK